MKYQVEMQHVIEVAVAVTSHIAESEEELGFRAGEKIIVEGKEGERLYGSIGVKRKGWFPREKVRLEEHYI